MRLPLRGGNWNNGSNCGPFALNLNNNRSNSNWNVGFRSALAPIRQKPHGQGCADGTGAKGNRLPPLANEGNSSSPRAASSESERGTGATWKGTMPKAAKNLWEKILDWDNLLKAVKEASRNKRFCAEVLRFNANRERNLLHIQAMLRSKQWKTGPFRAFYVFEPKQRLIHAPSFGDRVVHHAIVQQIGPFFERRFIEQSFACRIGKGTHAASEYLTAMLRSAESKWGKVYVLKADVTKYFYSIDHEILMRIVSRTIGDPDVLDLLRVIVCQCGCIEGNRGLPLGALTSQLLANAYLDQLDHFIKDELGVKYYVRYMDDFILLHHDKKELWRLLAEIRDFLTWKLRLTLNQKTRVFPASHGVDFAGYRHWAGYRLPRKKNMRRAKKRFAGLSRQYAAGRVELEIVRCCVASFVGYTKHCKGWKSAESSLSKLVLIRKSEEIPE